MSQTQSLGKRGMVWVMALLCIGFFALALLSDGSGSKSEPVHALPAFDLTVAKDGSGDYKTVQEAVNAAPVNAGKPFVIYIKRGVYREKVVIGEEKPNIHFIGEDREKTRITFNDYSGVIRDDKYLSNREIPTVYVKANDFRAENMTFEVSAGTIAQALALFVEGDRAVFEDVSFLGWQDTLRVEGYGNRSYFKNCYIEGHVDYIYGSGTAVFDECTIFSKAPGYITAASTAAAAPYGFVFIDCILDGVADKGSVYLGRPWKDYGAVAFINTKMSDIIQPEGWHNWGDASKEKTARYAEYNSTGPGATPDERVAWSKQLTEEEVGQYTMEHVLSGKDGWNPLNQIRS